METILKIDNLTKIFKGKTAVNNVSFSIDEGDVIGFVGNNGAGKTTTIKMIFGNLVPSQGNILYYGEDISTNTEAKKSLAFFPDQNNFPKSMKILDYIVYNGELSGMKRKEAIEKAKKVLTSLGLGEYVKARFTELSSGMQKKALLASVLITKPKMIILDEPTANVDVDTRLDFIKILKKLNEEGITIVITTHIIDELDHMINKLVILKEGNIVYNEHFDKTKEKISDIYKKFNTSGSIDFDQVVTNAID